MEIVASWQLQGREEGEAEGRAREALQLVKRQLSRRLGPLPAASADRLSSLALDDLEQLAEDLLDFSAPADLDRWLASRV